MKKTINKRIALGVGANIFSQLITVAIQIASLPILLNVWSIEQYGLWLILTTLPTYIILLDGGLIAVVMNRIAILAGEKNYKKAAELFSTTITVITVIMIFVAIAAYFLLNIAAESFEFLKQNIEIIYILGCFAILSIYTNFFDAAFRACSQYALGTFLLSLGRGLEFLFMIFFAIKYKTLESAALGLFAGRCISNAIIYIFQIRLAKNFHWRFSLNQWAEVKNLINPSIGFLAYPVGNAIYLQGFAIAIGMTLGPAFLAIFAAYRTLSRSVLQIVGSLNRSLWPEFSRLYGEKNYEAVKKLYKKGTIATACISFFALVIVFLVAPYFIPYWSKNKIPYDIILFSGVLISSMLTSTWQITFVLLLSINKHSKLSIIFLAACVIGFFVILMSGNYFGSFSPIIAMFLVELIMLVGVKFNQKTLLME